MKILELGLKPDGKAFYSDEEKAELLWLLFDEESKKVFDKGLIRGLMDGYDRGVRDGNTSSGW